MALDNPISQSKEHGDTENQGGQGGALHQPELINYHSTGERTKNLSNSKEGIEETVAGRIAIPWNDLSEQKGGAPIGYGG